MQLVESRDQVGHIVKLVIYWDRSTRYLNIYPPTKADVERLGYLEITSGEPYSPYSPFGKSTRQFRLSDPCPKRDRVKFVWTNEKIQEWRQCLGCVGSHMVNKTFASSTQYYTGVRYDREVMPKNSFVERFPDFSDSLRCVRHNK